MQNCREQRFWNEYGMINRFLLYAWGRWKWQFMQYNKRPTAVDGNWRPAGHKWPAWHIWSARLFRSYMPHPYCPTAYQGSGHGGSISRRGPQTSPSRATSTNSGKGIPRRSKASVEIWSLHLVLGLPRGLLPTARTLNTSLGRRPVGILTWCLNHLNRLPSKQRSGSILSSSRLAELLMCLREATATLLRKPISANCTRDLVLSVINHPSWPQVRVGTKINW